MRQWTAGGKGRFTCENDKQWRSQAQAAAGGKGVRPYLLYDERVPVCQHMQHVCSARLEAVFNCAGVLALGAGLGHFELIEGRFALFYEAAGEDAERGGGGGKHEVELQRAL